ncbi:MAG: MiaB/RimO family radical SAM methylthiotransferase [Candidatus Omnitrophica bacterium]|nr:MiaB/RimO family radical SAM methylthiotransferase [Candidatus Omnitrophota bacterium]
MKKIKFYTLGCKANQYDTQVMREDFLKKGFKESSNGVAEIHVVNTCVVTRKAENASRALIRKIKRLYPDSDIIIEGCLNIYDTPKGEVKKIPPRLAEQNISFFAEHKRAFLKVQDGCDNFCSYCIVPYVRGRSRSKEADKINQEFSRLIASGYKEIVITGICLGDYGKGLPKLLNLAGLIEKLLKNKGEYRIRISSIDPQYINGELLALITRSDKICRHLHIPFQSGDDEILNSMRRKYDSHFARTLVDRIRKEIKGISITTDIIVGFPGEEETQFLNTVKFLEFLKPLKVHLFNFSPRKTTPAVGFTSKVKPSESRRRHKLINELENEWRREYLSRFVNKRFSVLVEGKMPGERDLYSGYSEYYFKAVFRAPENCTNNLVSVKGVEIKEDSLLCTL